MLVVDASFILALFLNELDEEQKKQAALILKSETLLAPTLLPLEFGNTLLMKIKRGQISEHYADSAFKEFQNMDIAYFSHEGIDDLQSILKFAHRHQITFYDALYLKLAQKMSCKLATFDRKMKEITDVIGVELI